MLPLPVTWQPLHLINLNLSNCAQQSLSLLIFILSLSENKEGLREGKKGKKIGKKNAEGCLGEDRNTNCSHSLALEAE